MNPLTAIYGGVTGIRNSFYDHHIFKPRRLRAPVISVGNLSAGGAGKTPFVILVGELLLGRGFAVDVLTRGYRRKSRGILKVDPAGTAEQYGDEPLLISRKLNCPVIVGNDRYQAGLWAEKHVHAPADAVVHLLDDGFQHRQLARDFDIVLITPEDLTDSLIPAGRLRETLTALSRADAVVLKEGTSPASLPVQVKHVWQADRKLCIPNIPAPAIAFAGVARPQRFFAELREAGIQLKQEISFRDHYRYHSSDVRNLLRMGERKGAAIFVTTEKDAINLGPHLKTLNPVIVPMKMEVPETQKVVDTLLEAIGKTCCSHA